MNAAPGNDSCLLEYHTKKVLDHTDSPTPHYIHLKCDASHAESHRAPYAVLIITRVGACECARTCLRAGVLGTGAATLSKTR